MTRRTSLSLWALGIAALLLAILLVRIFGNWADCVVTLTFGQLSGFYPLHTIVRECIDRALFSFFIFR
jgi:hypothetical protein